MLAILKKQKQNNNKNMPQNNQRKLKPKPFQLTVCQSCLISWWKYYVQQNSLYHISWSSSFWAEMAKRCADYN